MIKSWLAISVVGGVNGWNCECGIICMYVLVALLMSSLEHCCMLKKILWVPHSTLLRPHLGHRNLTKRTAEKKNPSKDMWSNFYISRWNGKIFTVSRQLLSLGKSSHISESKILFLGAKEASILFCTWNRLYENLLSNTTIPTDRMQSTETVLCTLGYFGSGSIDGVRQTTL
jgi:hypothetical protein